MSARAPTGTGGKAASADSNGGSGGQPPPPEGKHDGAADSAAAAAVAAADWCSLASECSLSFALCFCVKSRRMGWGLCPESGSAISTCHSCGVLHLAMFSVIPQRSLTLFLS
jgi:hypothetical protein